MITDLHGKGHRADSADVAIVGAGTAGLVMAAMLARHGMSVVCLESGGWTQEEPEHPLNEVVQLADEYSGAVKGRFRCLGGTSTRWGGALIPFLARDLQDANWPIDQADIAAYIPAIESLFRLGEGPYELPDVLGHAHSNFIGRMAKWPRFADRNVFNLVSKTVQSRNGPQIWLNSTVTRLEMENARLAAVVAQAPDGSSIRVQARDFVLAAGAIETTRLLLLMQAQNPSRFAVNDNLGRYLHDHLSAPVADLEVLDRVALNRLAGFRFDRNGTMRNLRFELSGSSTLRGSVPACFAHIAFQDQGGGGFSAVRDLLQSVQRRRLPPAKTWLALMACSPWLLRALWWRYRERRLLYPDTARIEVHLVIEQQPTRENRMTLSNTRMDVFGQPLAQIEWRISPHDRSDLGRASDEFEKSWNSSPLAKIANFKRRSTGLMELDLGRSGGIYHPGGTTRMGATALDGVVDRDLRLFGCQNVRAVATSSLPTGGGANPTMTLLLLALRSVDQLARDR